MRLHIALCIGIAIAASWAIAGRGAVVTGRIVEADSGDLIPARLYISDASGAWFFAESASEQGSAVRYQKKNWMDARAVEYHTTLSRHPFRATLPPGRYLVRAERGKEYHPIEQPLAIGEESTASITLPLRRWVDMAGRRWYSGDTHVHRPVEELSNVMLAEDLNVALPLTYWVTRGMVPPERGDKTFDRDTTTGLIELDPTHVVYPRNTEYEIFTVGPERHTLGALFVLNQQSPMKAGVPPVGPVVDQAKREGALLDLDKHNWPWSITLIPLAKPDLFELANNHHWRTRFAITNWAVPAPSWMDVGNGSGNELAWTLYGFQTYYALLNCGFRMSPSAGTASGVHPVPLGFGRVYVHLPEGFSYNGWIDGLKAGRSFVTTGPMLMAQADGKDPGEHISWIHSRPLDIRVTGQVVSARPVDHVELIRDGAVAGRIAIDQLQTKEGAWAGAFDTRLEFSSSGWLAVRCWEPHDAGRKRFAHTGPMFIDKTDAPPPPARREAQWLLDRAREEFQRSQGVLPEAARREYQRSVLVYEELVAKMSAREGR